MPAPPSGMVCGCRMALRLSGLRLAPIFAAINPSCVINY
ncbi:hypothetical protein CKO_03422 [Citrobacter koseri ATCC BAA-895]|uniref:Uncharacterized protein n=1 Tax=Citrobacter koseri (strain ATCC BAA-895 / CDC 4225-83 / SGSC4696) TaxID=290338 RepID=A8ALZ3_CITK8|nr:hypothetical protein CKO_03422 [Citrobacter koseri ATCC BAA-895]